MPRVCPRSDCPLGLGPAKPPRDRKELTVRCGVCGMIIPEPATYVCLEPGCPLGPRERDPRPA